MSEPKYGFPKDFPKDEFARMVERLYNDVEDVCETREEINVILTGLVLTVLATYSFNVEAFCRNVIVVHRNAVASVEDVTALLKPYMKGDANE